MRDFRTSIMAPIGEPIDVLGTNPVFAKPKPFLPPIGRPVPPISIGGIGGIGGGLPSELLPIKGGPQPIPVQPINVPGGGGIDYGVPDSFTPLTGSANERGPIIPPPIDLPPPRPLQPIDIPAPILPDPRALKPRGKPIGNNVPGGGGIDYGVPDVFRPKIGGGDVLSSREVVPIQPPTSGIEPPVLSIGEKKPIRTGNYNLERRRAQLRDTEGNVPGGGGIDYGPGMGGGLIPPQDFGFGPGIRPTEIFDEQGNIVVGSGGVTPPGGNIRTMDFQDTDMNGVDDRDQPDFGGPSQEYLDQQERMRQIFNPNLGITPRPDPGAGPTNDPTTSIIGDRAGEIFVPPTDVTGMRDPNIRIGNYGLDRMFGEVPVTLPDDNNLPPTDPIAEPVPPQVANPVPSDPVDDSNMGIFRGGPGLSMDEMTYKGPFIPPTDPSNNEPVPTPDPAPDPVTTPTPVTPPATMPVGAIDPVLLQQATSETLTDPLIRSLYFGTQNQPGFFQQLQQAGANLIGQDVPLQQTAGLTPLELLARQQAVAGIGGFEPFFQQNKDLIDQAIGQSRRAEALRDPYFQRAEQQMLLGLGDQLGGIGDARGITLGATDRFGRSLGRLGRQQIGATDAFGRRLSDVEARGEGAAGRFGESLGGIEAGAVGSTDMFGQRLSESEDLIRGTLGGYDQGLTQQFYNPFEDAVVQQTIDDVLEAGDKQDIASRAREISSGAFGGSRARLGAMERREALGEGLAQALGRIRQQGFSEAQRTGLSEFARQREAERAASRGLSGLAGTRFGAESGLFDRLTSGAQQRLAAEKGVVDLLGRTGQQQLGAQQQLGSTLRGLTGDQFGAQRQLAQSLLGYGSAGAGARQNLASGLLGIGQQRGSGASALGQQLAGFGQQIGGIGSSLDALRRGQRGELANFGSIGRGIAETGLSRIYQQQLGQQQRPLGVLGQIGAMLPGYQQTRTQIDSQYGMPTDPTAAGLGAAFSAYGALAPRQGSS